MAALQTYLNNREDLADLAIDMVNAAQALMADTPFEQAATVTTALAEDLPEDDASRQLRLL